MPTDPRIPPQDIDAEMALIGSMMNDRSVFDDVLGIVTAKSFYMPLHGQLFDIMAAMYEEGRPIDLLTVSDELRRLELFGKVGGAKYQIDLAESACDTANAKYYARIVRDKAKLRDLIQCGNAIVGSAFAGVETTRDILDAAESKLLAITQGASDGTSVELRNVMRAVPADLTDIGRAYVKTGLAPLDDAIGGIPCGAMTIVAARPSVGKTALALQIAVQATGDDVSSLFVSIEMSASQLAERVIGTLSHCSTNVLRFELSPDDRRDRTATAVSRLGTGRIHIVDDLTHVRDIVSVAKSHVREHGVRLIAVDYLQLCEPAGKHETQNLAVASMSKAFKRLARDTGAAVLVVSQLSRDPTGGNPKPTLQRLRDSGALEQDADVALLLWRDDKDDGMDVLTDLIVAKNRNGPTGTYPLTFHKPTTEFRAQVHAS